MINFFSQYYHFTIKRTSARKKSCISVLIIALALLIVSETILIANETADTLRNNLNSTGKGLPQDFLERKIQKEIPDSLEYFDGAKPGPYSIRFSAEQDSAYFNALRLHVPVASRISYEVSLFAPQWEIKKQLMENSPWQLAMKNLETPSEYLMPSFQEKVQHQINILNSQYVPFVRTISPYNTGLNIPLSSIGSLLGLVEDVSPNMKFSLDYYDDVEIVVYSLQAAAVATVYKGRLAPGSYKFTWNLRNDNGLKMPTGDYVAEIKIGIYKYIRKWIKIP